MTSNRRDVQQYLYVLDDLATALGRPFATDTKGAFKIIDAVELYCRTGLWSLDMPSLDDLYPIAESSLVWSACVSPGIAPEGFKEAVTPGWKWIWRFVG